MGLFFKAMRAWALAFVIFATASTAIFSGTAVFAQTKQDVRVGVYDNYPKIYRDESGDVKGFWADLTNAIADKNNWNIIYVYGSFDQGLDRLKKNQIDMMVDVGESPERQKDYDFNNEYVVSGWATVYARKGITVNSFLDLANKKIAVMQADIHETGPGGLTSTLSTFGVKANIVETETYDDVFKMLDSGQADAGVVNGLYGAINENKYQVTRTGILFDPVQLKYALPKGAPKNTYFISTIDSNLIAMKQDHGSIYYRSLDANFGRFTLTVNKVPIWFYVAIAAAGGVIVMSLIIVVAMRMYQKMLEREIKKRIGQIKDSEEKYSAVVNQAQDAIAIIQDQKIQYVNRTFALLGYSAREIIGMDIADIIAPAEKKKVLGFYLNRIAGLVTPPLYETVLVRKDGTEIDVEISSGIINYRGEPADLVIVRNISDRKKLEKELKLQNTMLTAELEASINGVLIIGKSDDILFYNQRFVDMWQVPEEALESGSQRVVLNSVYQRVKDPQEFLKRIDYLYSHPFVTDRLEVHMTNGTVLDRYTAPFYIDKDEYAGRIWFFLDITNQKLHTEKLAQAEQAKHEFVSVAAHQLRAPSAAITAASKTIYEIESDNLNDTQRRLLRLVIKGAKQMSELVDFLLKITRAETGAMTLEPTPVSLKRLTNEVVREVERGLKKKSMKVSVTQEPAKIPQVYIDKNALTQVIVNLLTNAIEYSPSGSAITVAIIADTNLVEYSVKDEGIGIAPADLDKIFDKFYRSGKAKELSDTGTGLGLPLVKSLVQSWGGKVWVESDGEHGSTFYFTIPVEGNGGKK